MTNASSIDSAASAAIRPLLDVLLVDDDCQLLEMLEDYLSGTGFNVRSAATLKEAASVVERNMFRCMLVDQNLGDGKGLAFLQDLREAASGSQIILMSGAPQSRIIAAAQGLKGFFKFVAKPFRIRDVRRIVEAAIVRFGKEHAEQLRSRELQIRDDLTREGRIRLQEIPEAVTPGPVIEKSAKPVDTQATMSTEWAGTQLQKAYLQSITSLTRAVEAKDQYTHGHSERVYYYCSLIAEMLDLSESSRNDLRFASVLHDIGKIGIPDEILLKKSRLNEAERAAICQHPLLSESIISPLPFLAKVRRIVRHHHEHFDGSGYPDGLRGSEIPIEARILAVADAYDAMRSDRPYRTALAPESARARLLHGEGSQFCPVCVRSFLIAVAQKGDYGNNAGNDMDVAWNSGAFIDLDPHWHAS